MPLSAGTRLGPYEIIGPLGAGGMGEVYRAHDSRLNRDVAIKTLPAAFFDDADRLARLRREAQALAALNHPNIAAIYGIEEDRGVRALVMELVEGPTLAERIGPAGGHPGRIPLEEALDIVRQMADALEAAHEKGIIHRDLKPANVKVTPEGRVKVLDFGLAKAFDAEPASGGDRTASPTLTLEATRAGVILGTAGYMSPEQARGKPVDKRADIWSFGVVLYEMLTGCIAFEGETVSDTLAAVLRAEIDWKRLPAGTPPNVRKLLQRCLEREPRKRLRDIGDARLELDAAEEPVAASPPPARQGRSWLPWAAAAIGIGAGAGGGWGIWHTSPAPLRPVVRWSYTQKETFGLPALSRDGTRLVFAELTGNTFRLVLRMLDQTESKPLPGGEGGVLPVFSPDGQWIAFLGYPEATVKKIPVTGGTPITLAEKVIGRPDWGENGEIAFSGATGLMKVAATGGQAQALTTVDSKKGETGHRQPDFLPGGQALLFTIAGGSAPQVAVLDLKKGVHRTLVNDATNPRYVPTGHLAYLRGNTALLRPSMSAGWN
ncbi:MAG: protein kinase domain-containing protein [Bryobacteraceae bacterium]